MRLLSWNVNGIRAAERTGFIDWLIRENPDIMCVQETKARQIDVSPALQTPEGYSSIWHSAKRKGYSGVATFYRNELAPVQVSALDIAEFDDEGRTQIITWPKFTLINAYFPNSQPERNRLDYKLSFVQVIHTCCSQLVEQKQHVIICGDFNIAHKEIDLARPDENRDNPGFYPEECAAMDALLQDGFVDTFRSFYPDEGGHYTWWSYRTRARERNIGWRLDYHIVDSALMPKVRSTHIHADIPGSDHCPVELVLDI